MAASNECADQRSDQIRQVVSLIIRASRLHRRGIDKRIASVGLHHAQLMMLSMLSHGEAIPSQREIADKFEISPACVARTLKALSAGGYITRTGAEGDQRRNNVRITDEGLRLVAETKRAFDQFDQDALADLSEDELAQLTRLLERILENLRRKEAEENSMKGDVST